MYVLNGPCTKGFYFYSCGVDCKTNHFTLLHCTHFTHLVSGLHNFQSKTQISLTLAYAQCERGAQDLHSKAQISLKPWSVFMESGVCTKKIFYLKPKIFENQGQG